MPDYEVRYFHADGKLAVVHVTVQPSERHAREYARHHQGEHLSFELRVTGPQTQR